MKEVIPAAAGDIMGRQSSCWITSRFLILSSSRCTDKKVILVDHNEMAQAVDKLNMENIVEIVTTTRLVALPPVSPYFSSMNP